MSNRSIGRHPFFNQPIYWKNEAAIGPIDSLTSNQELTWDQKVKKYKFGIDPVTIDQETLEEYVESVIYMNEANDFTNYSL